MLKLKSSARKSKRYLVLEGKKEDIEKAILDYIGILGWSKAAPLFVDKIGARKHILAVYTRELNNVKAAFAVSNQKIKVHSVSGTIKGLKKYHKP